MTPPDLHFVVPGPLDQRTGGYLYDARMVDGLRALGWAVEVHELDGTFPGPDTEASSALHRALESIAAGGRVVVDGLAMGGHPTPIEAHADRLSIVSLVHHPLADETGTTVEEQCGFTESERRALAPCAGVIVTSAFTAGRLREYGVSEARIRVVSPGTEPAAEATGPGAGAPSKLVCVGTLTPRKGHDVLVAALERVRDLPWNCVCAGALDRDPVHTASVFTRVSDAGLRGRITFVDELGEEALDELYRSASLFVLASHYEGYGMALTEALARGLPIVSTTGGAIPYTVPADAGVLVEPGDVSALAAALHELLSDHVRRDALASAARRRARGLPTWAECARDFADAVRALGS